jgi:DNA-binding transcriptional LysR family regulator
MSRPLPPLRALQAFDAAARHGSFARAARELFVTQAAISQQIKRLEAWLGCVLFERHQSFVKLTPAGERLQPTLRAAFASISDAALALRNGAEPTRMRISALPNIATHWLIPRLGRLLEHLPNLQVEVVSAAQPLAETFRDCDIAIRTWQEAPEFVFERLFEADMVPVASAALLEGREIREPAELLELPLIHHSAASADWSHWFEAADVPFRDGPREFRFDSHALVLAAAKAGLGVALGRTSFIAADIASGQLVRLSSVSIPSGESWYVVLPHALKHERVGPVRDWLIQEGLATRAADV